MCKPNSTNTTFRRKAFCGYWIHQTLTINESIVTGEKCDSKKLTSETGSRGDSHRADRQVKEDSILNYGTNEVDSGTTGD